MRQNSVLDEHIKTIQETIGEDYSVWTSSGDGFWVRLYSPSQHVSIELEYTDGKVKAKAYVTVFGFLGFVEASTLCLPNKQLRRSVIQLRTIKHFLPDDNINDYESLIEE